MPTPMDGVRGYVSETLRMARSGMLWITET